MDKITSLIPSNPPCIITLDPPQYNFYQQHRVEIHSPNGEQLAIIGKQVEKEAAQTSHYQLRDQISLLEDLLAHIQGDVGFSQHAVSGLADMCFRMHDFLDKQISQK